MPTLTLSIFYIAISVNYNAVLKINRIIMMRFHTWNCSSGVAFVKLGAGELHTIEANL